MFLILGISVSSVNERFKIHLEKLALFGSLAK